jgi:hypothetical protein
VDADGRIKVPDRRTFRHWANVRVDNKTLANMADEFLAAVNDELRANGITLGRRIIIDSTPLESLYTDTEARYNTHYKKKGYKIFGVHDADLDLPLTIVVTTMERADGPLLPELLEKLHCMGIEFEEVFADGAFNGLENFAIVHRKYGAKFYTRLDRDARYRKDGTIREINRKYSKFWKDPNYVAPDRIDFGDRLDFLLDRGEHECVGAYYRNEYMREWYLMEEFKKQSIPSKYNERNMIEGFHGFLKQYVNLQSDFKRKGIEKTEHYVFWSYLAILGVVLTRLQNGITTDLKQIAFFA